MKLHSALIVLCLSVSSALVTAQQAKPARLPPPQPPPPLVTPEVHSDNSVTFLFRAPNAQEVKLTREGTADPLPMQKDDAGVWTVNTPPLSPDYYGYSFVVDGVRTIDPNNHLIKTELALEREHGARARTAVAAVGTERCAARRNSSSLLQVCGRRR